MKLYNILIQIILMRILKLNFNSTINQFRNIIDSKLRDVYLDGPENMVETANFVMSKLPAASFSRPFLVRIASTVIVDLFRKPMYYLLMCINIRFFYFILPGVQVMLLL